MSTASTSMSSRGATGAPLVLVHGSWTDHDSWAAVAPLLARGHRVMRYDRRGHSRSGGPRARYRAPARGRPRRADQGARRGSGADRRKARTAASSRSGLAARRPDLVADVSVHEPPATAHAGDGELGALVADAVATVGGVERRDRGRGRRAGRAALRRRGRARAGRLGDAARADAGRLRRQRPGLRRRHGRQRSGTRWTSTPCDASRAGSSSRRATRAPAGCRSWPTD